MSKVKTIPGVKKSKLIASLRRKETAKKKRDRIANEDIYRYGRGYWVREEKRVGHYKIVEVPEHTEVVREYHHKLIKFINADNEVEEKWVSIPTITEKIIPARRYKACVGSEYIPVPAVPRRINTSKIQQFCKKQTARKVRRKPLEEVYENSSYKRLVDLAYELY